MIADRAYLKGARIGAGLGRLEAEVTRILTVLGSTGAIRVEPAALQPADVALDLYGEDIRARAFVTSDDGAELMLRPDFTLPLVRLHLEAGATPARYAYCGPVWRRQEFGSDRPREYLQAGFEIFEAGDPAATDAEVLGLVVEAPFVPVVGGPERGEAAGEAAQLGQRVGGGAGDPEHRLDPRHRAGVEPGRLRFEASFGRTTLEYYDGLVFGALPRGRPDLPPIASGGRYDALTRALGHGRGIPAVGGMLRPEALLALKGGAAC